MGIRTRTLMQNAINTNTKIKMYELIAASRADNPNYGTLRIGEMRAFSYMASTQDKLPYWDMFPLIFVLGVDSKGFTGINLHYLPNHLRTLLYKKIEMTALNFPNLTPDTRLRISYDILNQSRRFPEFVPCFKRYKFVNLRSPMVKIDATEWEISTLVPDIPFRKASMQKVYQDARVAVFNRRHGR